MNRIGGELPPREPPKCVELPKSRRKQGETAKAAPAPTQNGKAAEESEEESDEDDEDESDEE